MTEENLDHLETGYIYLNFTPVITNGGHKPKAAQPIQQHYFSPSPTSMAQKAVNQPYKTHSLPVTYETLSEKDKALYDRCLADAMVPESTRIEQKLFNQVANNTAAFTEKTCSVSQSEFEAYRKQFALSKKEIELQEQLFNQVAGK